MDCNMFCQWLRDSKNMTERSAKDVLSRCKRIQKITGMENLEAIRNTVLTDSEEFLTYSTSVKSQLKRARNLYLEYMDLTDESEANT